MASSRIGVPQAARAGAAGQATQDPRPLFTTLARVTSPADASIPALQRAVSRASVLPLVSLPAPGLAMLGLYASLSFVAAQRRCELAIRVSVGADSWAIRGLPLRECLALVMGGPVLGTSALAASLAPIREATGVRPAEIMRSEQPPDVPRRHRRGVTIWTPRRTWRQPIVSHTMRSPGASWLIVRTRHAIASTAPATTPPASLLPMAISHAPTVDEYLAELSPERRTVVATVRDLVNAHLPAGYREGMAFGMIGWVIPLERYPKTYNRQPLQYIGLAAQKHHYALYLMGAYANSRTERALVDGFARAGKKLEMGRSCLRFKRLDDLALDVVAEAVATHSPDEFIAVYEAARAR